MTEAERSIERNCPPHNAINDEPEREEGFYHCEECADIIRGRFVAAIQEFAQAVAEKIAVSGHTPSQAAEILLREAGIETEGSSRG